MLLSFAKMHGLGNDFMVVDGVGQNIAFSPQMVQRLADRRRGIGFDQLLLVEPPYSPSADFHYRIYNADGSEVSQCGNGARCFARFVRHVGLTWKSTIRVGTNAGEMTLQVEDDGQVTVNMGVPKFAAADIPLQSASAGAVHRLAALGTEHEFFAVNLGNPHAVLRVDDAVSAPVALLGQALCEHPAFPQQANIGFAQVMDRKQLKLRVYERGCGETEACGSGACAAVIAGRAQGWLDEAVLVTLPGGSLRVHWAGDGQPVYLSGPATLVYEGQIEI